MALPLARIAADAIGATRLAGAFQDFFRFEFRARHTVGLGDVPRLDDEPAVVAAVERAGADDVVARLRSRARYPTRTDLAGRRRRVVWPVAEAGARARLHARRAAACWCSTNRPPRSTPRPSTPCSSATRRPRAVEAPDGRITILVSHRFSTVRMADLIVVLDGARLVESGTHEELMASHGPYSELYTIQAAAYR